MPSLENFNPPTLESKEKIIADSTFYPLVNEQLQHRYDRIATQWDSEAYANTRRDDLIPKLLEAAQIKSGHKVLEAMCGTAILAQNIKGANPTVDVCGLDFSVGMLNQVPNDIFRVQASVLGLPFEDESFDRILLRSAIYDLPRRMQRNALAELHRVLKKDSIFILQTYTTENTTRQVINAAVSMRDRLAGQYQDMGQESPRYFATNEEFAEWFEKVGFKFEIVESFVSTINAYQKANEMSRQGKEQFSKFMSELPEETKKAIGLRVDGDGNYIHQLAGAIYKLVKI